MAGPQEILAARYARRLQRKFSLKGPSVVVDVGPEIIGVVQADPVSPEDFYLADERLCMGNAILSAPAGGLRAQVELRNPVGSGVIVIVERVSWLANASVNVRVSTSPAFDIVAQVATVKFWRDTRIGGGGGGGLGSPSAILAADNTRALVAAGLVGQLLGTTVGGDSPLVFVLAPGTGLIVEEGTDATAINETWYWRERPLEPSEV